MNVQGIIQPMHVIKLHPHKICDLMAMIAKGLYYFHFGKPLHQQFYADVTMFSSDVEPALWALMADYFPPDAPKVRDDLGRGSFMYEGAQSPAHKALTVWRMAWHGGIRLHGANSPPQGVSTFWAFTLPTSEASAATWTT